jgi:hypothetical protein
MAWEHWSIAPFANNDAKSSGLQSNAPRNINSRRETRAFQMDETFASLDGYYCWPEHNFNRNAPNFSIWSSRDTRHHRASGRDGAKVKNFPEMSGNTNRLS